MCRARFPVAWTIALFGALVLAACQSGPQTAPESTSFLLPHEAGTGAEAAQTRKVIVFVHGIGGDARATWTASNRASWPELFHGDKALAGFDVYSIGYYTPLIGKASDIDEIATRVLQIELLDNLFRHYDEIYFVSHSMGGLVLKRALVKLRGKPQGAEDLAKVAAVMFIATPAAGAKLADWASWLSQNPQLENMRTEAGATYLNSIGSDWRDLLRARPFYRPLPRSFCAYEVLPTMGVQVVPRLYSESACDADPQGFDTDHSQIVKPRDRSNLVYLWTRARILETSAAFAPYQDPADLRRQADANMRPYYYSLALKNVQRWLGIEPNNPEAHYYAAKVDFKLRNFSGAIVEANEALRLRPGYDAALFVKAAALMRLGDYGSAKPLWIERLRRDPDYPGANLNLAETDLALGDFNEAKPHYLALLKSADTKGRRQPLLGLGLIAILSQPSSAGARLAGVARFKQALCLDGSLQPIFFGQSVEESEEWFDLYQEKIKEVSDLHLPEYEAFLREVSSGKSMCSQ